MKEKIAEQIKEIGKEIIEKADKIVDDDLSKCSSIIIHAEIKGGEMPNFDIIKNYVVVPEFIVKKEDNK